MGGRHRTKTRDARLMHTPGPWEVGLYSEFRDRYSINAQQWTALADVVVRLDGESTPTGEGEANARLIAAAPDLLASLQELERWFITEGSSDKKWPPFVRARAAIARATGRIG